MEKAGRAMCFSMKIAPCGLVANIFFRVENANLVTVTGDDSNIFFIKTKLIESHQYKLGETYVLSLAKEVEK